MLTLDYPHEKTCYGLRSKALACWRAAAEIFDAAARQRENGLIDEDQYYKTLVDVAELQDDAAEYEKASDYVYWFEQIVWRRRMNAEAI